MPQNREKFASSGEKHDQARGLTEQALEEYAKGNPQEADKLVEQAKKIDRSAVEEVVQELEEDAAQRGEQ
jgi:uncharacterized protein Yka (UPF0111/DUF47 family)